MIAYIRGILTMVSQETIIVDVNGIGYEIVCANPFTFQHALNEEVKIHTYHHVRDDAQILYGFKTEEEKHLFMKLISVSGIGPKSGLAIQGHVSVDDFVAAVEREDEKYLMSFPGVGKKTARQIILDLKGKLTDIVSITQDKIAYKKVEGVAMETVQETQEALLALGYKHQEIQRILPHLHEFSDEPVDQLIRRALKLLTN